jgi:hypothetical protein
MKRAADELEDEDLSIGLLSAAAHGVACSKMRTHQSAKLAA